MSVARSSNSKRYVVIAGAATPKAGGVQRIERTRIDARIHGRKIGPDEVVPACAQACPAEAIVFGNLNDPASRVSRLHGDARRYDLLHELGTRPRTAYLVKIRNPNPELEPA